MPRYQLPQLSNEAAGVVASIIGDPRQEFDPHRLTKAQRDQLLDLLESEMEALAKREDRDAGRRQRAVAAFAEILIRTEDPPATDRP